MILSFLVPKTGLLFRSHMIISLSVLYLLTICCRGQILTIRWEFDTVDRELMMSYVCYESHKFVLFFIILKVYKVRCLLRRNDFPLLHSWHYFNECLRFWVGTSCHEDYFVLKIGQRWRKREKINRHDTLFVAVPVYLRNLYTHFN